MTGRELIDVLYENVTFPPAIASKRFVRDMYSTTKDHALSERATRFAWRIAYVYRRQLPADVAEEAMRRKVDHQWVNIGGNKFLLECSSCKSQAWYEGHRSIKAPCPGPPEPKKTKSRPQKNAEPTQEEPKAQLRFGDSASIALKRRKR